MPGIRSSARAMGQAAGVEKCRNRTGCHGAAALRALTQLPSSPSQSPIFLLVFGGAVGSCGPSSLKARDGTEVAPARSPALTRRLLTVSRTKFSFLTGVIIE